MRSKDASPIVVMGVSGSGKSTLAAALASALGRPFIDADDLHPEANVQKMAAGIPLDDGDRAPWLQGVGAALAAPERPIVACSALARRYRDALRAHAPEAAFVFLHGDEAVLAARIAARSDHFMPASLLASQLAVLEHPGADESVIAVDIASSPEAQLSDVLAGLARLAES